MAARNRSGTLARIFRRPSGLVRLLRKVAFWEATFFMALCVAWVVSLTGYKLTGPWAAALLVVGFTHGCVFTAYLILVLLVRSRMRWSLLTTGSILVAGLVPGGGYVVEAWALSGARMEAVSGADLVEVS